MRANRFLAAILLAPLAAAAGEAQETSAPKPSGPLPVVSPASAGMSASRLDRIDAVVTEAVGRKELPGAVVLVGRHGKVVFRRAYGKRAVEPQTEPIDEEPFDSRVSDTMRIVYGKSSAGGIIASSARCARAP